MLLQKLHFLLVEHSIWRNLFPQTVLFIYYAFRYRHHYTHSQLNKAYPNISYFFELKEKYDRDHLFENLWSNNYGRKYYKNLENRKTEPDLMGVSPSFSFDEEVHIPLVEEKRTDSFKKLLSSSEMSRLIFILYFIYLIVF